MSSSNSNIRAGIVDNALVVSFMAADTPRVWRADMGQLLTAALEVQNSQGKYTLVMKRSGAPAEEIVTFSNKEDAVGALQAITDTLLQGTGGCTAAAQPEKSCGWFKKTLKFVMWTIAGFCVFVVALNLIVGLSGKHLAPRQGNTANAPAEQTGVPTPADSILGK